MEAAKNKLQVGTRVRLQNIKGDEKSLNGMLGTVTHPIGFTKARRWVGVALDVPYGTTINVRLSECIPIGIGKLFTDTHESLNGLNP